VYQIKKPRTIAIVATLLALIAVSVPVAADLSLLPGGEAHVSFTNGDGVNVRSEPGFGAGIISTLDEGMRVTILEGPVVLDDGTGWYAVSVADVGVEGWVNADYLSGGDAGTTEEVVIGTAIVRGTNDFGLRLRDGASIEAATIAIIPEESAVSLLAEPLIDAAGMSWTWIAYNDRLGYSATAYLYSDIGGDSEPVEEAPQPEPNDEPDAEPAMSAANAVVLGTGGGGLNLRDGAGFSAGILTVIPEGVVIRIVGGPTTDSSGSLWYPVDFNGVTGWALADYLSATDQEPTSEPPVDQPDTSTPDSPEPDTIAPATGVGAAIVAEALNYVGVPYVWGGTTPAGFDCSGFTYYVVNRVLDNGLSRDMDMQVASGQYVSPSELLPGDLVFFQNTYTWGLSHVGIYMGGGQFVNAQSERVGVAVASLWDSYWGPRYYTARRIG
jgi:cell wall-associated NlpC family hydrolase